MELLSFFKSVLEQERASVVLCDTEHRIVYMNPAAIRNYQKYGGAALLGRDLRACHQQASAEKIEQVVNWFKKDKSNNWVYTFKNEKQNKDVYMVALRDDAGELIGYYEKHEYRSAETMKPYDIK